MKADAGRFSVRLLIHLLVLRPLLGLIFGISVEGEEHLGEHDRFVLASNHNSHLDILLLFGALPVRHILKTRPVAAGDYFMPKRVLFRLVDYLFRPIWIVRGGKSGDPMAEMKRHLEAGGNIIIFPEGTRGEPGRMGKFRGGVSRLVETCSDVPVIPVFLSGPERALPKDSAVPLPIWNHVTIGPPQLFTEDSPDFTTALRMKITELSSSVTANRHRRVKRVRKAFMVAVLGIDGSGKSTVSRRMAVNLSGSAMVCLVSDRLEFYVSGRRKGIRNLPSERFRQALGRYAKTARSLKHYKIPKLAELLLRDHLMYEIQRWYAPDIVVLDGSPLINLTAWAKLYKGDIMDAEACRTAVKVLTGGGENVSRKDPVLGKLPELAALDRLGLAKLHMPDVVVMLDVPPAVSMERISSRGEKQQVHETEDKLGRLREGYLTVCEVVSSEFDRPVRIINGESGLDEVSQAAMAAVMAVRDGNEHDRNR